ncbi:MAG: MFS transporter [Bacteroidales bacterium]|nr:MFS transporter [Bacteroidales bacterium]
MTNERLWNKEYLKAWSANFMLFFSFMLVVPLLPIYLHERFYSTSEVIGVVLSGYTWVAMLTRAGSGYLVDTLPRKQVLVWAWFLLFVFFAGYILAGSLLLFAMVRTLHGVPFGVTSVSNSTVAIDVLPPSRRAEGIGYYGLSNNLATATAPTVGLLLYHQFGNFDLLFGLAMFTAFLGLVIDGSIHLPAQTPVPAVSKKGASLLSKLFLSNAWPLALNQACYGMAYSIIATYLAIYGVQNPEGTGNTGVFFAVLSGGLIVSRLTGGRQLRRGRIWQNCAEGISISAFGFLLFATIHHPVAYYLSALIVGFGNGHMFPAMQMMFVNIAGDSRRGVANSTQLAAWDGGAGLGTLLGGVLAGWWGYESAFWLAAFVQALGVVTFFLWCKGLYLRETK